MSRAIAGIFRNGKVELLDPPPTQRESRVVVTFVADVCGVDLEERGIGPEQAADLRRCLAAFEEDWNREEMDVYDAV